MIVLLTRDVTCGVGGNNILQQQVTPRMTAQQKRRPRAVNVPCGLLGYPGGSISALLAWAVAPVPGGHVELGVGERGARHPDPRALVQLCV